MNVTEMLNELWYSRQYPGGSEYILIAGTHTKTHSLSKIVQSQAAGRWRWIRVQPRRAMSAYGFSIQLCQR
jgi:hypothetical protein